MIVKRENCEATHREYNYTEEYCFVLVKMGKERKDISADKARKKTKEKGHYLILTMYLIDH